MTLQKASQWDVKLASKMQGYKSLSLQMQQSLHQMTTFSFGKGKLAIMWLHGARYHLSRIHPRGACRRFY